LFEKPVPEIGGQLGVWQQDWDNNMLKWSALRQEIGIKLEERNKLKGGKRRGWTCTFGAWRWKTESGEEA